MNHSFSRSTMARATIHSLSVVLVLLVAGCGFKGPLTPAPTVSAPSTPNTIEQTKISGAVTPVAPGTILDVKK